MVKGRLSPSSNLGKNVIGQALRTVIYHFHSGDQIKYSFVLMLIILSSLATSSKFQNNICFKTRVVGLININTKEYKGGRHLRKWSICCSRMRSLIFPLAPISQQLTVRHSRVTKQYKLNRQFSNSHGWTGSSMKWRLMRANLFKCKLICPH